MQVPDQQAAQRRNRDRRQREPMAATNALASKAPARPVRIPSAATRATWLQILPVPLGFGDEGVRRGSVIRSVAT
jgi:hypothetical protein